ncbi:cell division protein FtsQ [Rhizomicrobium palustre]|jgi:cell division protein FtsQ|uniref:Cell division protein FtsQ n=1 Tax=Rhizomicrobium palustre TaxID=189966 RepID=A0A846MWY4_9PROT|nr:FtsQ-type POTRA domain-containing protein [Rhizomicrobium palustre]NIK87497.1 cell division protein FtsQ [Rhizomicrobium palustre]
MLGLFRRPMLLLTVTLVFGAIVAAIIAGHMIERTMSRTDTAVGGVASRAGFVVSKLHLDGNHRTKASDIMAALRLHNGQTIFALDLQAARARLLSLPWVADAEVRRRYPDDVSVHIIEREPYARWQDDKSLVVVARDGHVITADGMARFAKLPLLMGDGAPENAGPFLDAVARHRSILSRVTAYQYQSGRRWNLLLDDGVVVKFPETGWDKELSELDRLILDKGILEKDIREIDLRNAAYLYFFLRNGGTQREKRAETGSAI